ncbi:MAG: phosphoenolpyruvate synthase [Candidatus Aenigmarchaeota archaeon]|nr:phosphoenolpyruvate synthase [Candidatus Aenigmarchaeota archaeon]MBU5688902.1 phosphoenolpyruvate synthase [Candidatus Aenigmarchaeota archaeon]
MRFVKFLKEMSRKDLAIAGGKGANLAEMYNIGLPVPNAFVVTAQAYKYFLEKTKLNQTIFEILKNTDVNDSDQLQKNTQRIRDLIEKTKIPEEIEKEIEEAYEKLSKQYGVKEEWVVARSSATAEDLPDASFAGQQLTVLNIKGSKNVIKAIKQCWASLFTARATFYRVSKGFDHSKVLIAVPVQKQVDSEKAGVGFTIHPSTGDKNKIMIEGSWGQGESVVSGSVTPDTYILDKKTGEVLQKHIATKLEMRILDKKKGGIKVLKVPKDKQNKRVLTNSELEQLYKLALKLENHYKKPQDFEWTIEKGKVYLVQTRPITVIYEKKETAEVEGVKPILQGLAASPGIAQGVIKIIKSPKELSKIKQGDILVTKMTNPDFVPAMKRAAGIITDEGGQTSHAAIVSRELGVVCVVGTKEATKKLKDGNLVTIDGYNGKVYLGKIEIARKEEKYEYVKTKTKVYINLGEPELAERYKDLKCDGVGLMRAEFMASEVGKHPKLLIKRGGDDLFINTFAKGIEKVAKAFYPRPIVYRALDFKTNEYADLAGGKRYEPHENNPMIGWRGASRYITEPETFELELRAIKKVRDKGYDNVYLMIPFVRTLWELDEIKKIIDKVGLSKDKKFKLWIMVEVPSAAILIEEFCKKGIDGVSIGSNDLTQLILGVDRDSAILGEKWFNELDPAVLWALERIIKTCKKYKVTCSICGQLPSTHPEIVKQLVKWGVTSVSVNPDVVDKVRSVVAEAEKGLIHKILKK